MACQRRFRFFVSALIVLIANPLAAQEMDVTHQHLSLHSELVWQNVRDDRQLVDGAKPSYSIKHQLSVVCLKPGESIEFLVPENELVRALLCEGNDAFDQPISMWISDGSGAYRRHSPVMSQDGRSLVIATGVPTLSIARILCEETSPCPVTVALFTSRRASPRLLDQYRCEFLDHS